MNDHPADEAGRIVSRSDRHTLWTMVIFAIGNDIATVLMFVWWGVTGQLPLDFALGGALFLGTAIAFVWLSPFKIWTGVGWLIGVLLGLIIGDWLLGIPLNGPVPNLPGLMFQRLLGPIIGSSGGASSAILCVLVIRAWSPFQETDAAS